MFHWKDGLFLGRRANGDVRVMKFAAPPDVWPDADDASTKEALFDVVVPEAEWISIVASVAKNGENSITRELAAETHRGAV